MASHSEPRIYTYIADGAIVKGQAVKFGTDNQHVTPTSATSDLGIGIAQGDASTAGDSIEVALPGGGAKALASGVITKGNLLVQNGSSGLQKATGANDQLIAMAMDDAVANDIFGVEVIRGQATAAQS